MILSFSLLSWNTRSAAYRQGSPGTRTVVGQYPSILGTTHEGRHSPSTLHHRSVNVGTVHQPSTTKLNWKSSSPRMCQCRRTSMSASKHEEHNNFDIEGPETKDSSRISKKINTATVEGHQLKLEMKQCMNNKRIHKCNKTTAHGCVIGQCTQAMKNKLRA